MKVIVISLNEPFWVGCLVGKWRGGIPVVRDEAGRNLLCLGMVIPHSDSLERWLSTMSPDEQTAELLSLRRFWASGKDALPTLDDTAIKG